MNKNLLRVIVYGANLLIFVGSAQLMNQAIPNSQIFSMKGMIWFITVFLIIFLCSIGGNFILRKYGAQITTPKERKITTIIFLAVAIISFGLMTLLLMNK